MWPFTALRIKTDLKIFSGNFIEKKTELYEMLGETEEKTWVIKVCSK